jgi:hypothetical protein
MRHVQEAGSHTFHSSSCCVYESTRATTTRQILVSHHFCAPTQLMAIFACSCILHEPSCMSMSFVQHVFKHHLAAYSSLLHFDTKCAFSDDWMSIPHSCTRGNNHSMYGSGCRKLAVQTVFYSPQCMLNMFPHGVPCSQSTVPGTTRACSKPPVWACTCSAQK